MPARSLISGASCAGVASADACFDLRTDACLLLNAASRASVSFSRSTTRDLRALVSMRLTSASFNNAASSRERAFLPNPSFFNLFASRARRSSSRAAFSARRFSFNSCLAFFSSKASAWALMSRSISFNPPSTSPSSRRFATIFARIRSSKPAASAPSPR